jgi:hypothetical protein
MIAMGDGVPAVRGEPPELVEVQLTGPGFQAVTAGVVPEPAFRQPPADVPYVRAQ